METDTVEPCVYFTQSLKPCPCIFTDTVEPRLYLHEALLPPAFSALNLVITSVPVFAGAGVPSLRVPYHYTKPESCY